MRVIFCDGCGQRMDGDSGRSIVMTVNNGFVDHSWDDVCPECYAKIEKLIFKRKTFLGNTAPNAE